MNAWTSGRLNTFLIFFTLLKFTSDDKMFVIASGCCYNVVSRTISAK